MKHDIDCAQAGTYGEPMAEAIQTCVHCGFCLPACPTYQELGQEADSPRGRILLMKEALEGKLELEQIQPHIDRCLGCVACVTACPSGVEYGELISPFRAKMREELPASWSEKLKRTLVFLTLPYPHRFRWALRLGRWTRGLQGLTPPVLRPMLQLIPNRLPRAEKLREVYPAVGKRQGRVALLAGCAQQVLRPSINRATIGVLNRRGIEVVVPRDQGCCGALAWHVGHAPLAKKLAIANLRAFPGDVDAIVTNAAGCGSGLHDYPTILRESEWEVESQAFAKRAMDVSVFLRQLPRLEQASLAEPTRVAMQDACHLQHAQRVKTAPRQLLAGIPNLQLVELPDGDTCCGSAGTYNIDQPEIAANLGRRKADLIRQADCRYVLTGNIGCLVQLQQHLAGEGPEVLHTIEFLDRLERQAEA